MLIQLDFLPGGEIVSGQRICDFINAVADLESKKITLGPCVCQDALGIKKGCYERSKDWMVVICNCEREICVPFRYHQLAGGVLHPGPDTIEFREDLCVKSGRCVQRCHFGANRLENGALQFEPDKCFGCGVCVSSCPAGARKLKERKNYKNVYYPLDFTARILKNKAEAE